MKRALVLAEKGAGFTSPNPCVGAVIVKNGEIIGEGWHKKAGDAHAEIEAIKSVKDSEKLKGADLYVTLEPCCHFGKTPPCTSAIIGTGIKRVFVGMEDPFKKVNGKGIEILKKAGVKVEVLGKNRQLYAEIRHLNKAFIKWAKTGFPYLTLKAGMSLDGKITFNNGQSKWITGEKARNDAKLERSRCDCVVVGANTVAKDNPELGTVGIYRRKRILRVIIDGHLKLSVDQKIFRDNNVFVACTDLAKQKDKKRFEKAKVEFKSFGKDSVSVEKLLKFLAQEKNITSVFVEGGSNTHGAFYDAYLKNKNILDRVMFYIAPMVIGGKKSLPVIAGNGLNKLMTGRKFSETRVDVVGNDWKFQGYF